MLGDTSAVSWRERSIGWKRRQKEDEEGGWQERKKTDWCEGGAEKEWVAESARVEVLVWGWGRGVVW